MTFLIQFRVLFYNATSRCVRYTFSGNHFVGHKMLAHDGAHGHSGCMLTLLPDKDISVFTCVNGYKPPSRPELTPTVLNMFIMDILLGNLFILSFIAALRRVLRAVARCKPYDDILTQWSNVRYLSRSCWSLSSAVVSMRVTPLHMASLSWAVFPQAWICFEVSV